MPGYLAKETIGLIQFWEYDSESGFQRNHSFIVPEPKAFNDIVAHKNMQDRKSYLLTSRENKVFFFCQ